MRRMMNKPDFQRAWEEEKITYSKSLEITWKNLKEQR
jgi:hypothetical protein